MRLNTKQRFALTFTLYVFSFLVILYSIFFLIFSFMIDYQLRVELAQDTSEIINNHLLIDKNNIVFRKDKTGASLKEFLINENASALIFNSQKIIVRSYGFFAYDNGLINDVVTKSANLTLTKEIQLSSNNQNLKTMIVPLKINGKIVGMLALGKSTSYLDGLKQTMWTIFSTLGLLSLIGSFIVGYFLARKTLNPMIKLGKTIETMDVDKLDKTLQAEGHPQDEIVLFVDKFNEMIDKIKNMSTRQKAFIANASHELKTPLTRAISTLEVMQVAPELKKDVRLIKEDLFYLDTLLENLLFLTKLKKNDKALAKKLRVNMDDLFSNLRRYFKSKLLEKEINLVINVPTFIETALPGNYLEIVLSNLLSNAIKYSRFNSSIMISVKNGLKTSIKIIDHGVGMTKEEVSHMFDRFYRGKTSYREHGYGIGLSIVKQICDIYEIPIDVYSVKEKGTSITLVV